MASPTGRRGSRTRPACSGRPAPEPPRAGTRPTPWLCPARTPPAVSPPDCPPEPVWVPLAVPWAPAAAPARHACPEGAPAPLLRRRPPGAAGARRPRQEPLRRRARWRRPTAACGCSTVRPRRSASARACPNPRRRAPAGAAAAAAAGAARPRPLAEAVGTRRLLLGLKLSTPERPPYGSVPGGVVRAGHRPEDLLRDPRPWQRRRRRDRGPATRRRAAMRRTRGRRPASGRRAGPGRRARRSSSPVDPDRGTAITTASATAAASSQASSRGDRRALARELPRLCPSADDASLTTSPPSPVGATGADRSSSAVVSRSASPRRRSSTCAVRAADGRSGDRRPDRRAGRRARPRTTTMDGSPRQPGSPGRGTARRSGRPTASDARRPAPRLRLSRPDQRSSPASSSAGGKAAAPAPSPRGATRTASLRSALQPPRAARCSGRDRRSGRPSASQRAGTMPDRAITARRRRLLDLALDRLTGHRRDEQRHRLDLRLAQTRPERRHPATTVGHLMRRPARHSASADRGSDRPSPSNPPPPTYGNSRRSNRTPSSPP